MGYADGYANALTQCAEGECRERKVGKSKYCRTHRAESRKRFKAMLAEKDVEKAEREREFSRLWNAACEAGQAAGQAAIPTPMRVADERSGQTWDVSEGACGFAWVNVKPGNSAFANWLKRNGFARRDGYYGGVTVWISEFGQSIARKEAFARAMAEEFSKAGIRAYWNSRMD